MSDLKAQYLPARERVAIITRRVERLKTANYHALSSAKEALENALRDLRREQRRAKPG